ncbi:hypothetical protein AMAG_02369 [Allomyces macrogynus ATCC 38327]|uniref:Core Histone H2A/H2B/H3 domain-containing protein n=1 Tax=Allomyces macrogynus (strain ATCC 38327) TaxID=578462 RepID=A0A0L0S2E9_ALLM3|nr:hypothetical protein AMAG_02369 [Allomyces macrogynus ATCC 38327]|eukprot:KNE56571.1 hypothetical protein AMAG_02369 [Allomyces macrogynus ATCC 38327]
MDDASTINGQILTAMHSVASNLAVPTRRARTMGRQVARKRGGPRHATPIQVTSAAPSSSATQRLPTTTPAPPTTAATAPAREARPAVITVATAPPRARPEIDSFGAKRPVRSTLPIRSDKRRHKVKYPPVLRKPGSAPVKRGSRAIDEIKQMQKTSDFLIPKISFQRVVRDILMTHGQDATGYRIQPQALAALQEATEAFLVNRIEDSYSASIHARRVTLFAKDMTLARRLSTRRV